jgi:hypothetical protein
MMVVFLYNNPAANAWLHETRAWLFPLKPEGESRPSDLMMTGSDHIASLEEPLPLRERAEREKKKLAKSIQRRCTQMDEDELIAKVECLTLENASEEEWQESLLATRMSSSKRLSLVLQHSRTSRTSLSPALATSSPRRSVSLPPDERERRDSIPSTRRSSAISLSPDERERRDSIPNNRSSQSLDPLSQHPRDAPFIARSSAFEFNNPMQYATPSLPPLPPGPADGSKDGKRRLSFRV